MDVNPRPAILYQFGRFTLDTRQSLLLRDGEQLRIPPKTFEVLLFLARNPNQVLDKKTLMQEVWNDAFVEDANLAVHISNVRKILNDDFAGANVIETFPKVGYRFNAEVTVVRDEDPGVGSYAESGPDAADSTERPPTDLPSHAATFDRRLVILVLVLILLTAGGFAIFRWSASKRHRTPTLTRVEGMEQITSIALSPNGEYIAHSVARDGKYALTVTHIGTGSRVQLLAPDPYVFWGITFSKDGGFLYYIKQIDDTKSLFKIPILGHKATKLLDDVGERVSLTHGGDRICFVRQLSREESAIMTATSEGQDVRVVAVRRAPEYYSSGDLSWSPDGNLIANVAGSATPNAPRYIVGIDVKTGTERLISDAKWAGSDGIDWLSDGSGLVAALREQGNTTGGQVWFIPFPSSEPRRLTNDLNDYGSVSVSASGDRIMSGQFKEVSRLWVVTPNDSNQAKPIATENRHLFRWVRWGADGRLLFGSDVMGNRDVWALNPDGTGEAQLTRNAGNNVMPTGSPDGKFIVFASNRFDAAAFNLWRIDANGENPVQLTFGAGENQPAVTADSKWVIYTAGKIDGAPLEKSVWKVPAAGGEAIRMFDEPAYGPDVSPDGKYVAAWYKPNGESRWKVGVFPLEGRVPIRDFEIPQGPPVRWTPDGKGISFIKTADNVPNIWIQPITGAPPFQFTQFTSERISHFDWSADGQLVCSRTTKNREVVLISNYR